MNRRVSIIVMNKKAEEAAAQDGGTIEVDEPAGVSREIVGAAATSQ